MPTKKRLKKGNRNKDTRKIFDFIKILMAFIRRTNLKYIFWKNKKGKHLSKNLRQILRENYITIGMLKKNQSKKK